MQSPHIKADVLRLFIGDGLLSNIFFDLLKARLEGLYLSTFSVEASCKSEYHFFIRLYLLLQLVQDLLEVAKAGDHVVDLLGMPFDFSLQ